MGFIKLMNIDFPYTPFVKIFTLVCLIISQFWNVYYYTGVYKGFGTFFSSRKMRKALIKLCKNQLEFLS